MVCRKHRAKPFLGHEITKTDHRAIVSLVGLTCLPIGVPKRAIKTEEQLWRIVDAMFGMRPGEGEQFIAAVRRIRLAIARLPEHQRRARRQAGVERLGGDLGPGKGTRQERAARRAARSSVTSGGSKADREAFYLSWEWRRLRMEVLKKHGARCQCCGAGRNDVTAAGAPVRICVDHIQPLAKRWDLRLDSENLQVLCDECNQGKGAWDRTDWRDVPQAEIIGLARIEAQLRAPE